MQTQSTVIHSTFDPAQINGKRVSLRMARGKVTTGYLQVEAASDNQMLVRVEWKADSGTPRTYYLSLAEFDTVLFDAAAVLTIPSEIGI